MRLVVFQTSRLFGLFAAGMLVVAVTGPAAFAGTITFKATSGRVGMACLEGGGTYTPGTGPGGYGCKTAKGEVSCDKKGNCKGTCGNCQQRVVVGGGRLQGGLGQVLADKFAKPPNKTMSLSPAGRMPAAASKSQMMKSGAQQPPKAMKTAAPPSGGLLNRGGSAGVSGANKTKQMGTKGAGSQMPEGATMQRR